MTHEEIFALHSKRRRRYRLISAVVVPIMTLVFVGTLLTPWGHDHDGMVILSFVLCCVAVGVAAYTSDLCPSCNSSIGKLWKPTFCPRCGIQLERDAKRKEVPNKSMHRTSL